MDSAINVFSLLRLIVQMSVLLLLFYNTVFLGQILLRSGLIEQLCQLSNSAASKKIKGF